MHHDLSHDHEQLPHDDDHPDTQWWKSRLGDRTRCPANTLCPPFSHSALAAHWCAHCMVALWERVPHCAQSAWLWPVVRPQWSWQRRRSQPTSQHRYSHFWWSSLYRKKNNQPINQTTNQVPTNQPTNQSSNQPRNQPSSNQPRYSDFCRKFWCLSQ